MSVDRLMRLVCLGTLLIAAFPAAALAQEGAEAAEEIEILDNSFLIEEAYNQEQGIVQHIFNWVPAWERNQGIRENTFDFVFTQEWPVFGQKHQLSYTIPMLYASERTAEGLPATTAQGFGDIFLNYRYQLLGGSSDGLSVAPRASIILPTGDEDLGLGNDEVGYQLNLPISLGLERSAFHFNAGLTKVPGVRVGVDPLLPFEGRTLDGYNLGGSAIYFLKPNFHLMLESVALWDEELAFTGEEEDRFELILSPGFRWAAYTEGATQWVVGAGVPVGLSRDAPNIGLFLYMSFEHRVRAERNACCCDGATLP